MRVVISLATRGRGQQLISTVQQNMKMCSRPDTTLVIQADQDDYETLARLTTAQLDKRVVINVKPREDTIAEKWNRAMEIPADVYVVAADDDPYVQQDTDERILQAAQLFPEGIGMVYGHMANASFSGVVAPTAKLVELLGYIQPAYFPYWFCDHWTDDIARMINRISYADIRTDQRMAGQTQEMREPLWWSTWFDANYQVRRLEALKVIDQLDEPEWRKQMARNSVRWVEFRSRWINDNVRLGMKSHYADTKDERYQRVKQKAIETVPKLLATMDPQEAAYFSAALDPSPTLISIPKAYARA